MGQVIYKIITFVRFFIVKYVRHFNIVLQTARGNYLTLQILNFFLNKCILRRQIQYKEVDKKYVGVAKKYVGVACEYPKLKGSVMSTFLKGVAKKYLGVAGKVFAN